MSLGQFTCGQKVFGTILLGSIIFGTKGIGKITKGQFPWVYLQCTRSSSFLWSCRSLRMRWGSRLWIPKWQLFWRTLCLQRGLWNSYHSRTKDTSLPGEEEGSTRGLAPKLLPWVLWGRLVLPCQRKWELHRCRSLQATHTWRVRDMVAGRLDPHPLWHFSRWPRCSIEVFHHLTTMRL